jgi:hypothetical protein
MFRRSEHLPGLPGSAVDTLTGFLLVSLSRKTCPASRFHSLESYCDAKDNPRHRGLHEPVIGTPFGIIHI